MYSVWDPKAFWSKSNQPVDCKVQLKWGERNVKAERANNKKNITIVYWKSEKNEKQAGEQQ